MWQFRDYKGAWCNMLPADQAVLETFHSSDPGGRIELPLGTHGFRYLIDLTSKRQTNLKTRQWRSIRRVQSKNAGYDANIPVPVAPRKVVAPDILHRTCDSGQDRPEPLAGSSDTVADNIAAALAGRDKVVRDGSPIGGDETPTGCNSDLVIDSPRAASTADLYPCGNFHADACSLDPVLDSSGPTRGNSSADVYSPQRQRGCPEIVLDNSPFSGRVLSSRPGSRQSTPRAARRASSREPMPSPTLARSGSWSREKRGLNEWAPGRVSPGPADYETKPVNKPGRSRSASIGRDCRRIDDWFTQACTVGKHAMPTPSPAQYKTHSAWCQSSRYRNGPSPVLSSSLRESQRRNSPNAHEIWGPGPGCYEGGPGALSPKGSACMGQSMRLAAQWAPDLNNADLSSVVWDQPGSGGVSEEPAGSQHLPPELCNPQKMSISSNFTPRTTESRRRLVAE